MTLFVFLSTAAGTGVIPAHLATFPDKWLLRVFLLLCRRLSAQCRYFVVLHLQLLTLLRAIEKGQRFARIDTARFAPEAGPIAVGSGVGEPILLMTVNLKLLAKS